MFIGLDLNGDVIWAAAVSDGGTPSLALLARHTVEPGDVDDHPQRALNRFLDGFLDECQDLADDELHVSGSSGSSVSEVAAGLWPHAAQQVVEARGHRFEKALWPRHEVGAAAQRCRADRDGNGEPVDLPMAARAAVGAATLQAEREHAAQQARQAHQGSQGVLRLSTELASLRNTTAAEETRLRRERDASRSQAEKALAQLAERDRQVAALRAELRDATEGTDGLANEVAAARAALADHDTEAKAQQSELAREAEQSRRSVQRLQMEVAALQTAEQVARSATEQQTSVLEALEAANDQVIAQRELEREAHATMVQELRVALTTSEEKVATASDELERTAGALESAAREIQDLLLATEQLRVRQVELEEDLADAEAAAEVLAANRDDIAAERDRTQLHYEAATKQQRADHEAAMEQARAEREVALQHAQAAEIALENAHADHAAELKRAGAEAAAILQRVSVEHETAEKRLAAETEALVAEVRAEHEAAATQLATDNEAKLEELGRRMAMQRDSALTKLAARHDRVVDELQIERDSKAEEAEAARVALQRAERTHADALAQADAAWHETVANLAVEHGAAMDELRSAHKAVLVRLGAEHEAKLHEVREEAAAQRDETLAATALNHQAALDRQRNELELDRDNVWQKAQSSLAAMAATHEDQLAYQERMRERAVNEQMALRDSQQREMLGRIDDLTNELENRGAQHESDVAELKQLQSEALAGFRQRAVEDAETVRQRHEERLAMLRRAQEDRIAQLETAHSEAIGEALAAHRTIQTELHQRIADHQRSLADERQHSERARDALTAKHREVLSQLIEQSTRAHDQFRKDLEAQQATAEATLAEVLEDRQADERRFQNELDAVRGEASAAHHELAIQLEVAEKKQAALEAQLDTLQDERGRQVASHVEALRALERRNEGAEARQTEAAAHRKILEEELRRVREAAAEAQAGHAAALAEAEEAKAAVLASGASGRSPADPSPDVTSLEAEVRRLNALRDALQNQRDASREQAMELQRQLDAVKDR